MLRIRGFIGLLCVIAVAGLRADSSETWAARPLSRADLTVSARDARDPTLVDTDLAYRVAVTNLGPQRATRVRVVADVAGVGGVGTWKAPSGGSCARPSATRVVCTVAALGRTRTATVTVTLRPTGLGTVTLIARVSSATLDRRRQNNRVAQQTRVLGLSTVQGRGVRSTRGDSGFPTVTTEIDARQDPTGAGAASGTFTLQYAAISASPARGSDLRGRVVCLTVEGNRAMAGGVVESSNNAAYPTGSGVRLAFTDNGDAGAAPDTSVSFVGITGAPTCELAPPEQEERLIEGNFVVRDGEP